APAGSHGLGVKGVDGFAVGRAETDMQPGALVGFYRALGGADPERNRVASIAERCRALAEAGIAEWRQGGVVEPLRRGDVAYADRDMVEHDDHSFMRSGGHDNSSVELTP